MLQVIIASQSVFDHAIEASRAVGKEADRVVSKAVNPGLRTNLDGTLHGWASEAWESVEKALKSAFVHGREHASGVIESSQKVIERLLAEAGTRSLELHALLLDKMRAFMSSFLKDALTLTPKTLAIGDQSLNIIKLTCKQKIKLGGKLESNLLSLAELVSEGEFEVEVEYGIDAHSS
jgi:hypothetical protein